MLKTGLHILSCKDCSRRSLVVRAIVWFSSDLQIKVIQLFTLDVTKTGNGEWGMGNGEWGMGNGEWGMGNGEWGMGNGEWGMGMGNGKLKMGN